MSPQVPGTAAARCRAAQLLLEMDRVPAFPLVATCDNFVEAIQQIVSGQMPLDGTVR
jgi:hypothetical protein